MRRFKLLSLIVIIFALYGSYFKNDYGGLIIMSIIFIIIICSLYSDYTTETFYSSNSCFEQYYGYNPHNESSTHNYNGMQYNYTSTVYLSPNDIKLSIAKKMKPNVSIVLENGDKTKEMNIKKRRYISKIKTATVKTFDVNEGKTVFATPIVTVTKPTVTTPNLLLPPSTTTNFLNQNNTSKDDFDKSDSFLIVDNILEIKGKKEDAYVEIINFLRKSKLSVFSIREVLREIKYVDFNEYYNEIRIYTKNRGLFTKYGINTSDVMDTITAKTNTKARLVKYESNDILDYYDTKYS